MEPWSAREDERPYIRPVRSLNPWIAVAAIGAVAWIAALYLHSAFEPPASAAPPGTERASDRPAVTTPAGRLDAAVVAPSLPSLENSDSMMRDSVAGLIGPHAFAEFVVPVQLVRRIVATVDNLPRSTAARRVMPLNAVTADFTPDPGNSVRYVPYVRVLEALDAHALVQGYARAYPLFQRAYEELGFPGKYFNDRLMAALDDLLATPDLGVAPQVVRPRVLYEFADPDLEARSAGQKILLRMGADNAARVKAKLWEVRRALIAASSPPIPPTR